MYVILIYDMLDDDTHRKWSVDQISGKMRTKKSFNVFYFYISFSNRIKSISSFTRTYVDINILARTNLPYLGSQKYANAYMIYLSFT